ncbi:liprin-beta-1 isoform X1 [Spodoptera frugiperda]|uniref:Liprin-beta-1 isoform X1 n=1 Tax=Spodoptera frugiperda TaxID=7108 RepID=A0A9R0EGC0_SPOFR|nr:liprin-beta-1 isoform X1 [Spodoptera frugiperda]
MRELGRGGSLVAATIAALHNRTVVEEKPRSVKSRSTSAEIRNVARSIREENFGEIRSRRISGGSERPLSTASEASERDSASVQSSEEPPPQDSGDSDSPDEATVKCTTWTEGAVAAARTGSSDTESSSSSADDSDEQEYETGGCDAEYRTLTPSRRLDNSTRRDDDFTWMPTGNMVDEGDERVSESRVDDYSAASLERRRRTPGDRQDRDRKSRSSLTSKPPQHPTSVRASPRPRRSRNEETPPELQRRWNSYEHFRWPEGGWWPPMCWCHGPPVPPPCYMHDRAWPSNPSLPPMPTRSYKNDAEDRVRRLEADKESLHLQVQVLSEQIAAQTEKMTDLERALQDARQRLDDAEQRLQKEMLQRSSLETQKLELLSKLSEVRLRAAERGILERSPPPPEPVAAMPIARPAPPRTPPANYGRTIERNTHMYSSLPRSSVVTSEARVAFGKQNNMVVARGRGHSVPNLAEKEESSGRSSSPGAAALRARLEGGDARSLRPARPSTPRLRTHPMPWETIDVREWDCETTCGWLESLGLEVYVPAARTWLGASPDARGQLAAASHNAIEKELAIKHPLHKKKILLGLTDLLGGHGDPLLTLAGRLDTAWTLRWLEDVGACGARAAAGDAALDARLLHRLTHADLHAHLRVTHALHALSIRRGIQVLRDNKFDPDTMIRRAAEGETVGAEGSPEACVPPELLARWSSHRVMQWLKEIDLAEYAPNLRGAGVHGGLMLLEPRFTAELLAALLNIPANKTLLRRHLTQRFNDLLGRDVIQQKRNAEQTLGYQPLTATTKYKVPKKSQFSLKRKKSKDDLDLGDLVCPLHDDCSGDITNSPTMKVRSATADVASAVSPPRDEARAQ